MARSSSELEGLLVVDKPSGITSHDVVARLRRVLGERRIGHAGTLDPDATGVLVLAVGHATRLLRFVSDLDKSYRGEVVLGVATSTLDASGTVTERCDMSAVELSSVRDAALGFIGAIEQVPPMVSAVRVGGRRLYELARAGEEIERSPRPVVITRLDIDSSPEPGVFTISMDCSSGTYVRVVAADLGVALGGVAHLRNLVRTRVGSFTLERAISLEDTSAAALDAPLGLVAHLEQREVDRGLLPAIGHGRSLDSDAVGLVGDGPVALVASGELVAIYRRGTDATLVPVLVYRTADPAKGAAESPSSFRPVGPGEWG